MYEFFSPVGLLSNSRYLLVTVLNAEGYSGLNLMDLETGKLQPKTRFYPGYDIMASSASSLIIDNLNGHLMGIRFHHNRPDPVQFV